MMVDLKSLALQALATPSIDAPAALAVLGDALIERGIDDDPWRWAKDQHPGVVVELTYDDGVVVLEPIDEHGCVRAIQRNGVVVQARIVNTARPDLQMLTGLDNNCLTTGQDVHLHVTADGVEQPWLIVRDFLISRAG